MVQPIGPTTGEAAEKADEERPRDTRPASVAPRQVDKARFALQDRPAEQVLGIRWGPPSLAGGQRCPARLGIEAKSSIQ